MINKKLQEEVDISALRYALGRSTYIVKDMCSYIKYKTENGEYEQNTIKIMLRDIKDYFIELSYETGSFYSFECDVAEWSKLYEVLIEHLDGFPGWFSDDLEKFVEENIGK